MGPWPPEVIVIGGAEDEHAVRVVAAVGDAGARVLLLDFAPYPAVLPLAIGGDGAPLWRGRDLRAAGAAYVRSIPMRLPFFDLAQQARAGAAAGEELVREWEARYGAERERQSFLAAFVLALERAGLAFANPTATLDQHFVKLDQLAILRAAGLPVPRTLATNDPDAVRRFVAEVGGRAIVKPLAGGALCRRVEPADLAGGERTLALVGSGALFQEEAPGENVRVYVVGGRAVAAYAIESGGAIDYRGAETAIRPLDPIPERLAAACVRAAAACGMAFTGVDVRYAGEARFAVLECNPSPMFAGIEKTTGARPVTTALREWLIAEARARRSRRA